MRDDDRTVRALEALVGAERARDAMTYFAGQRVAVVVSDAARATANGAAAERVAVNMLRRFVGWVEALTSAPVATYDAVLAIGVAVAGGDEVINVAFDAWTCMLRRAGGEKLE